MILEDDNFLSEDSKHYINTRLLGEGFVPFYFRYATENDNALIFNHTVINRLEKRKEKEYYNSSEGEQIVKILHEFCNKNKIKINEILRCSINITVNNGLEKCSVHNDHDYPHNQLIVYLNDVYDKNSKTVIIDGDSEIKITPKLFKAVMFDNKPHYHYFPKQGHRVVGVFTFR